MDIFDVAVVGGGHAGYEAAFAAARMGCRTILVTMDMARIGTLSCNPAIGGTAKGHLVKEIDALGGMMGFVTDQVGIQFRMLNLSRGPAVWSPRAQVDRAAYPKAVQHVLDEVGNLQICGDNIVSIVVTKDRIKALRTEGGQEIRCLTAVLTCGTFLNGIIHVGLRQERAGRFGERPATGVTESLVELGFQSGRLKTGTPPRIHKESIDFSVCEPQFGDEPPEPFSWKTERILNRQVPCHLTYTNRETHEILRSGFDQSPMFTGRIKGTGPRYCPSIEDKVNRFADKDRHQIFLEPEGYTSHEYYVNGFSTSLPEKVQSDAIRTVRGLEKAVIIRPGYAVEYDFFPPHQIELNLESRLVKGLFFAGQINGTSGYEEAAAQGLMAGANAALSVLGRERFVLRRSEAYIGVLIDDLVSKSTVEPYRIFTSLAEYRLLLRKDNADLRLTERGRQIGLVPETQYSRFMRKKDALAKAVTSIENKSVHPVEINSLLLSMGSSPLEEPEMLRSLLKRPEVPLAELVKEKPGLFGQEGLAMLEDRSICHEVETTIKYEGYLKRQEEQIARYGKVENKKIPISFDYSKIRSLSAEAREKLALVRPESIGQAGRISGISPADVSLLMVYLEKCYPSSLPAAHEKE